MKIQFIKIISIVLMLVIAAFTFTGCELGVYGGKAIHIFPEGYTAGLHLYDGSALEYWWVETYKECLDAIELLKSHGSTFVDEPVFACDEDMFDVKYCFKIIGDNRHGERIKFGDNPFDRWAYDVEIYTYVFFDNVTIDELVYSYVGRYEAYEVSCYSEYQIMLDESFDKDNLTISDWTVVIEIKTSGECMYDRKVSYCEQPIIYIVSCFYTPDEDKDTREFKMTDECVRYLIDTAKIIEPKDTE